VSVADLPLASPDAGHVTGRSIVVDGGMWST
jgi:hypothetical protein